MKHPLRENLEIVDSDGTEWICCSQCQFQYCRTQQDWREVCKVRLLPPSRAGRLMSVLDGQYSMRQYYCPSCAALVDTDFVAEKQNDKCKQADVSEAPNRPEPQRLTLDSKTTAV